MKMRFFCVLMVMLLLSAACAGETQTETAVSTSSPTQPAAGESTAENPAGTEQQPAPIPTLPVLSPAPSWENEVWINSDQPIALEDLRGKVVLLEFWTFG